MNEKEQKQKLIDEAKNHTAAKVGSGLLLSAAVLGAGAVVQTVAPAALRPIVASADTVANQIQPGQQIGDSSALLSSTSSSDLTDSSQWTYSTSSIDTQGTKVGESNQKVHKDNANLTAQSNASAQGLSNSNSRSALHGGTTSTDTVGVKDNANLTAQSNASAQGIAHSNPNSALHGDVNGNNQISAEGLGEVSKSSVVTGGSESTATADNSVSATENFGNQSVSTSSGTGTTEQTVGVASIPAVTDNSVSNSTSEGMSVTNAAAVSTSQNSSASGSISSVSPLATPLTNPSAPISQPTSTDSSFSPKLEGNRLILTGEQGNTSSSAQFNSSLDMSRPFKFGGELTGIGNDSQAQQNYLGVAFIPVTDSQNDHRKFGIEGLPNAIFAGWTSEEQAHYLEVVTTDGKGNLLSSGQSDVGINPKVGISINSERKGAMTVVWDPIMQFSDGIITGSLTATIGGKTVTHANLRVPEQVYFGIIGATNGKHAPLGFDFSESSFIATKKAAPVVVRYIDQATGFSLVESTKINSQIGQVLHFSSKGDKREENHYGIPKISGYHVNNSQNINLQVTDNALNNEVSIFYEGDSRQQETNYQWPNGEGYQAVHHSITGLSFPEIRFLNFLAISAL